MQGMFGYRPAYQTPLAQLYFNAPAPTSISAVKPTLSERVAGGITSALSKAGVGQRQAQRLGQKFGGALEALTPVGSATAADQARADYQAGNYAGMFGNGISAALGMLPDGGAAAGKVLHSIIAPLYHGSPHAFEKFALEKIGTGEGAQAYGHGLYFAENPAVAADYRQRLAGYGHTYRIDGQDFGKINDLPTAREAYTKLAPDLSPLAEFDPRAPAFFNQFAPVSLGSVIRDIDYTSHKALPELLTDQAATYRAKAEKMTDPRDKIEWLGKGILADTLAQKTTMGKAGHLYEVKLDANPEDFLNWDAPLGQQPQVADRYGKLDVPLIQAWQQNGALPHIKGETAYRQIAGGLTRGAAQQGLHADASQMLLGAGIPGISYLDQGSRVAGQGTRNYVVFDPSIIDILNRH